MENSQYIPGVCNIGPAEAALRKRIGWIGVSLAAVLWALFACYEIRGMWYLLLFFPCAISAAGFIQGKMHFCAAFGLRGLYNSGSEVGKTDSVTQTEFRAQDRKKAWQIVGYSTLAGLLVALVAYLLMQSTL